MTDDFIKFEVEDNSGDRVLVMCFKDNRFFHVEFIREDANQYVVMEFDAENGAQLLSAIKAALVAIKDEDGCSDDLVKRLRDLSIDVERHLNPEGTILEATQEIERLRVQNENLRQRLKNNKEVTDAEIERLRDENAVLKSTCDAHEKTFAKSQETIGALRHRI